MARESAGGSVFLELSDPGADDDCACQGQHAAHGMHDGRTCEVYSTVSDAEVFAQLRQPAAAPYPVCKERIEEHGNEEGSDDDGGIFDAFGHGSGRNGYGRIHKDHLEEEQGIGTDIIRAGKTEAFRPDDAAEAGNGNLAVQDGIRLAESCSGAVSAHLEGEAGQEETDRPDQEDHEVHCHRVGGILAAAEAGFNHCKTALEEKDHEAADHDPDHVGACKCLAGHLRDIRKCRAGRVGSVGGAGWIGVCCQDRNDHDQGHDYGGQCGSGNALHSLMSTKPHFTLHFFHNRSPCRKVL